MVAAQMESHTVWKTDLQKAVFSVIWCENVPVAYKLSIAQWRTVFYSDVYV